MGVGTVRLLSIAGAAALIFGVPLVRVVRLDAKRPSDSGAFAPADFAASFWADQLLAGVEAAAPIEQVLQAFEADGAAVAERYGRRVGVSRGYFLFVQGEGVLGEPTSKGYSLSTAAGDIVLSAGKVFGSTIRDATGLLDPSVAPSSRAYNELANALNELAERRAIDALKQLPAGSQIRFAGCAKVANPAKPPQPLVVTPIFVETI